MIGQIFLLKDEILSFEKTFVKIGILKLVLHKIGGSSKDIW